MLAIAKSTLLSATLIIISVVAATSEPNRIDFEQDFKALSSIARKDIQSELKSFGDTYYFANGYASNVDGKWGPSTNAALQEAYQYLTKYDTVSKNVTARMFLNLILQEYEFWLIGSDVGEGCEGCGAEGTDVVYETSDDTNDQSFSDAGILNANDHYIELPNFVKMASDNSYGTFDLSQYCATTQLANDIKHEIGTDFLGVKLTNPLCDNINLLSARNYKCRHSVTLRGSIATYAKVELTKFNSIGVSGQDVMCKNNENGRVDFNLYADLYFIAEEKHITVIPGSYQHKISNEVKITKSALLDYEQKVFYNIFNADITEIAFNCHALNSCTTSPLDLVKAIYSAKESLQKAYYKLLENRYHLDSIFGERVFVSRQTEPHILYYGMEGPIVSLTRGTIDRYTAKPLEF